MNENDIIYKGKVRDVYKYGNDKLCIIASNRLSSFDRYICDIPGKGELLTKMSSFWFEKTKHIINNHFISYKSNEMIVKSCSVIPVEIVVRAYITGNTTTSLWTHYNNGEREYCGIQFPNGLNKNQRLQNIVITPTTKGDVDKPISKDDMITRGFVTESECDYIYEKALELFKYGQKLSKCSGFILVDTKYEFGRDSDGKIILIDELHTCDSSRYWLASSYEDKYLVNEEPEKLDKDCIRDWVKWKCDPYKDDIPEIPDILKDRAINSYTIFYKNIIKSLPDVGIIMGSDSDINIMREASNVLDTLNINYEMTIVSAHRTPDRMFEYARGAQERGLKVIIAGAGGAAHLPGMVAALTPIPVIGVPVKLKTMDGMDSLLSIVQMPKGVPVATVAVNGAWNAGLLAGRIMGVLDNDILKKINNLMEESKNNVMKKVDIMEEVSFSNKINNFDIVDYSRY
jgi:phosphoribosylaminoimidazole-succinocarboxamide synthase